MTKELILPIIIIGVLIAGSVYYFSQSKPMEPITSESTTTPSPVLTPEQSPAPSPTAITSHNVILRTNKGDITLELFTEQMPITTSNFLKLAQEGYYTSTKFHRVIPNFMIQGGDSNSKGADTSIYGQGGPGYNIQDEFVAGLSNVRGTIAMANTGAKNSGGSQFFINLVDNTGLDFDKPPFESSHPVFGKVIAGMDVVDAIAKIQTNPAGLPADPNTITAVEVK